MPGQKLRHPRNEGDVRGTWETHKYPGVHSDSDLYTFGYRFKPWVGFPIASAAEILKYMGEVIEENGIGENIFYGHRITSCCWSSRANFWTVEARRGSDDRPVTFTANFLWMCQGYYDHEKPCIPDWRGLADYKGGSSTPSSGMRCEDMQAVTQSPITRGWRLRTRISRPSVLSATETAVSAGCSC